MSSNRYAIRAHRRALTAERWALLAQLRGPTIELTSEAATALHQIAFGGRRARTDTWDEADAGLCYLRVQHLVGHLPPLWPLRCTESAYAGLAAEESAPWRRPNGSISDK